MSTDQHLGDGQPLEQHLENSEEEYNFTEGYVNPEEWNVYEEDDGLYVRSPENDRDELEYGRFFSSTEELVDRLEVSDEGRFAYIQKDDGGDIIHSRENNNAWIQSTVSVDSMR